jgi:hypothetical protein
MYNFYENILEDKYIHVLFTFKTQQLKSNT